MVDDEVLADSVITMTMPLKIMRSLSRAAYGVACCCFGALALILYLGRIDSTCGGRLEPIDSALRVPFCLAIFVGSLLSPSKADRSRDLSPRAAGITVVLLTGLVAAAMMMRSNLFHAIAIVLATIATAAVVWRFATKHEMDIGEHRSTPKSPHD